MNYGQSWGKKKTIFKEILRDDLNIQIYALRKKRITL